MSFMQEDRALEAISINEAPADFYIDLSIFHRFDRHEGRSGSMIVRSGPGSINKIIPIEKDEVEINEKMFGAPIAPPGLADFRGMLFASHMQGTGLISCGIPVREISIARIRDGMMPVALVVNLQAQTCSLSTVIRQAVRDNRFEIVESLVMQLLATLGTMQRAAGFVHNDLHSGNIMCRRVDASHTFRYVDEDGTEYEIPSYGWQARIIDFSSCFFDGKGSTTSCIDERMVVHSVPNSHSRDCMTLAVSILQKMIQSVPVGDPRVDLGHQLDSKSMIAGLHPVADGMTDARVRCQRLLLAMCGDLLLAPAPYNHAGKSRGGKRVSTVWSAMLHTARSSGLFATCVEQLIHEHIARRTPFDDDTQPTPAKLFQDGWWKSFKVESRARSAAAEEDRLPLFGKPILRTPLQRTTEEDLKIVQEYLPAFMDTNALMSMLEHES